MAAIESGLRRPNAAARLAQAHLRDLRFALTRLASTPLGSLFTVLVLGLALALPALLQVAAQEFDHGAQRWRGALQISLFLRDSLDEGAGRALADKLSSDPAVASTTYISRAQALEEFRASSGLAEGLDLLDGINPLPAVIVAKPVATLNQKDVEVLMQGLASLPEVETAQFDQAWLDRLFGALHTVRRAIIALGLLLGVAVVVTIGNTIRLEIEARREEIEIMKLIGASNGFVRRPFLYTGFSYGLAGGLLAWLLAALALHWLGDAAQVILTGAESSPGIVPETASAPDSFDGLRMGLGLCALGIGLGLTGAWLALSRRLAAIQPR